MGIKARVEHLVKFNPIANGLFVAAASIGVKALSIGQRIDDRLILFVSDIGKSFSGSPRAIYERMVADGLADNYRIVWAFNHPEEFSWLGTEVVKLDSPAYFKLARIAKYWVTDVNIERGLMFKRQETRYLNTWHGSAIKTIGRDIHGRIYYNCSSIDWMCASSEYDIHTFAKAFDVNEDIFIPTGLPRNDYLWDHKDDDSAAYKRKLGLPEDKRVILYGPTWRDSVDGGKTYNITPPINLTKWQDNLGEDCVLVFRMHPLTQQAMGIAENDFCRDYSRFQPLNDLLLASDLLITDYSSMAFDFSILNRPVLCFGYDADDYAKDRGLYLDLETLFPKGVQRTEDELLNLLKSDSTWVCDGSVSTPSSFNSFGGNAASECIRILLGLGDD